MTAEKRICIGTAQWGMRYGIANKVGKVNNVTATEIMRFALENGVRYFDTAQDYGDSEEVIGHAIKETKASDGLKIISKIRPDFSLSSFNELKTVVLRSLERLHVTSLWGLLLHRIPANVDWPRVQENLLLLKAEGLVKNFGVSVYTPEEGLQFLENEAVDIIQIPFNILDKRWIDCRFFDYAEIKRKKIFVRSIYLQGLILLSREELIQKGMAWADPYVTRIRTYTRQYKLPIKLFALQTVIQKCPDANIIIGVETINQLKENIRMLHDPTIPKDAIAEWWATLPQFPERLLNPSLWKAEGDGVIVAIIQARMGSSRLPGKVLLPLVGRPILSHIIQRLRRVPLLNRVVVATSTCEIDNAIEQVCLQEDVKCYRGSEEDVLDRFYKAALAEHADHVIRITADCPLVDPAVVGELIDLYLKGDFDHCGVLTGAGALKERGIGKYPDGLDAEIFSFRGLEQAWKESTQPLHREHVTPFIWQQPDRFKLGKQGSEVDYGDLRFTVDNMEDYGLVKWIYESLYSSNPFFGLNEVVRLLKKNPEMARMNQQFIGKERYEEFWNDK